MLVLVGPAGLHSSLPINGLFWRTYRKPTTGNCGVQGLMANRLEAKTPLNFPCRENEGLTDQSQGARPMADTANTERARKGKLSPRYGTQITHQHSNRIGGVDVTFTIGRIVPALSKGPK